MPGGGRVREAAGEDRGLSRLGSFMDGRFAIAITLPVVQLTPPAVCPGRDLAAAYRGLAPECVAYLLGFVVIGVFWNHSHSGATLLKKTDHGFNLLTFLLLACVSLAPFPARPYVAHVDDPANVGAAALVYGCVLAAPSVVWFVRWCWGVSRGLYDPALAGRSVRAMTIRYAAATLVVLLGVVLLLLGHPAGGLAAVGLATASFLLPPRRPSTCRLSRSAAGVSVRPAPRYRDTR
ncbi:hypothetical protein tb265_45630 [Gemmatimonadetes bacterium T265]|nr:hypothetical protein tb265_45630 [Gemmatimonadetes bacterium T265]